MNLRPGSAEEVLQDNDPGPLLYPKEGPVVGEEGRSPAGLGCGKKQGIRRAQVVTNLQPHSLRGLLRPGGCKPGVRQPQKQPQGLLSRLLSPRPRLHQELRHAEAGDDELHRPIPGGGKQGFSEAGIRRKVLEVVDANGGVEAKDLVLPQELIERPFHSSRSFLKAFGDFLGRAPKPTQSPAGAACVLPRRDEHDSSALHPYEERISLPEPQCLPDRFGNHHLTLFPLV